MTENNSNGKPQPRHNDSGSSFLIATIAGIPIRVHFTFLLLLIFIAAYGHGDVKGQSAYTVVFVILLFTCVALHELGHALTARRYGLITRSIVLYPIGGIASIEGVPEPRQEFWIALAGPAVNFGLAALGLIAFALWGNNHLRVFQTIYDLAQANLILAVFNLIPAFPMDGGRILRALMAGRMDRVRATDLASQVGKIIAVITGIIAIIRLDLFLTILAVFIYMAADAENNMVKTRALVLGHKVGEAMIKQFETLSVGDTLREASEKMLQGTQRDFPVMLGDTIAGVLSQRQLSLGLLEAGPDGYVAGVMTRDYPTAAPDEALSDLIQRLEGPDAILVIDPNNPGSVPAGMITQERIVEFLVQLNNRSATSGSWPTS